MSAVSVEPLTLPLELAESPRNSTVFTPNMKLPVHRWFRYSAGFSAAWVEQVVSEHPGRSLNVLDPFAGSGTTLLASQNVGATSIGLETHPLVSRVARAKLNAWEDVADDFEQRVAKVLATTSPHEWLDAPPLMEKIYPPETLATLRGLKATSEDLREGDAVDELVWLTLVSILRVCSPVGTAQWQYVLPNKSKAKSADPILAFTAQAALMAADMLAMGPRPSVTASFYEEDAREAPSVEDGWADLVVTSPPYPNNYDYADATRIEMTFLGDVTSWGDLQQTVRHRLIRSCSQHMTRYDAEPILATDRLTPIIGELRGVYEQLAFERTQRAGKKNYHTMVAAYFGDLAQTWLTLRRVCAPGAEALFVVGDSAPYGVYVPVDRWLGELALAAGFTSYEFTKLRDRNLKWKNRKHRVPLHEGILRVKG